MVVTFKFTANNNNESQIKALEALKDNIDRIHSKMISMTRGVCVTNTFYEGKKAYFMVVYRDNEKELVDEEMYVAKINHPEKVAYLLYQLSKKTDEDDYLRISPEKIFLSYQKDEEYTLNGILFKIQTELKQGSIPSVKNLQIRIMAHDLITGSNCNKTKTFIPSQNSNFIMESHIRKYINNAIEYMTNELRRK